MPVSLRARVASEGLGGASPGVSEVQEPELGPPETGKRCKHIHAVEYVIRREHHEDGSETVTERLTVETVRKTYPQDWTAYNAAQTAEKHEFQSLLFDLCQTVPSPPQGKGRPRLPMSDAVFSTTFKVYSTFSGRRFMSDLRDAHERGYISRVPHFNSIFNHLDNPDLGPILSGLVALSARPLKVLETDFACDSTGFTTNRFVPWYDKKYRAWDKREHDWVKVHLMCGASARTWSPPSRCTSATPPIPSSYPRCWRPQRRTSTCVRSAPTRAIPVSTTTS